VRKIVEIIIENTIEFAPELAVVGASLDLQEGVLIVNKNIHRFRLDLYCNGTFQYNRSSSIRRKAKQ